MFFYSKSINIFYGNNQMLPEIHFNVQHTDIRKGQPLQFMG